MLKSPQDDVPPPQQARPRPRSPVDPKRAESYFSMHKNRMAPRSSTCGIPDEACTLPEIVGAWACLVAIKFSLGMTKRWAALPLTAALLGASGCEPAPLLSQLRVATTATTGQGGAIVGTVVDASTRKPLSDVVVTVTAKALLGEQVTVTDAAGRFRLPDLPPSDDYRVKLEKDGYLEITGDEMRLNGDVTIHLNAELGLAPFWTELVATSRASG